MATTAQPERTPPRRTISGPEWLAPHHLVVDAVNPGWDVQVVKAIFAEIKVTVVYNSSMIETFDGARLAYKKDFWSIIRKKLLVGGVPKVRTLHQMTTEL